MIFSLCANHYQSKLDRPYFFILSNVQEVAKQDRVDQLVDQLQPRGQQADLETTQKEMEAACSHLKTRVGILKNKKLSRLNKTCNTATKMDSFGTIASLMMGLAILFMLK